MSGRQRGTGGVDLGDRDGEAVGETPPPRKSLPGSVRRPPPPRKTLRGCAEKGSPLLSAAGVASIPLRWCRRRGNLSRCFDVGIDDPVRILDVRGGGPILAGDDDVTPRTPLADRPDGAASRGVPRSAAGVRSGLRRIPRFPAPGGLQPATIRRRRGAAGRGRADGGRRAAGSDRQRPTHRRAAHADRSARGPRRCSVAPARPPAPAGRRRRAAARRRRAPGRRRRSTELRGQRQRRTALLRGRPLQQRVHLPGGSLCPVRGQPRAVLPRRPLQRRPRVPGRRLPLRAAAGLCTDRTALCDPLTLLHSGAALLPHESTPADEDPRAGRRRALDPSHDFRPVRLPDQPNA